MYGVLGKGVKYYHRRCMPQHAAKGYQNRGGAWVLAAITARTTGMSRRRRKDKTCGRGWKFRKTHQ